VPIKTVERQTTLAWHRMRQGWIEERTALLVRHLETTTRLRACCGGG
jgi:hypothetical protein